MIKFAREPYSQELIEEMKPLWISNDIETGDHPLDPNLKLYEKLVSTMHIFTVRDEFNYLQGYQVFFIGPNPHAKEDIQAVQDLLFISPSSRTGLAGYRFLKWCINEIQREGVDVIYQSSTTKRDIGPLLKRLGFELGHLTYCKRINKEAVAPNG